MKPLFMLMAAMEVAIGLALLASPSLPVSLLLGVSLDTAGALMVARVAGAALLSLGVACWLARDDGQSRAMRGLIAAMLLYNVAVAVLLAYAGLRTKLVGVAMWPTVVGHAALAVWCTACLRTRR